jgi:ribose/xylose/arabinose/galactoside ABC-type transport system permease subunit
MEKSEKSQQQSQTATAPLILIRSPELGTLIAVLGLSLIIGFVNPRFWLPSNWLTIMRWFAGFALLAMGESMVLIIGGIDLSVGSMASLSSMIFAYLITEMSWDTWQAFIVTMVIAILVGLYHAAVVVRFSPPLPTTVPAFIVTLGSLILLRGIAIGMTKGFPIKIYNESKIAFLASSQGIALLVTIAGIITLLIQLRTVVGRYMYAIGGSLEAARVAGIPIHKARAFAFIYSSILASITGMLYAGLVASGYADIATGQELYAIASCAIAGVSLAGGEGNAISAILGALLISIVRNGIVLMGVSPYWQDVGTALILVIAVIVDLTRRTLFAKV